MDSRTDILTRVRARLGRDTANEKTATAAMERWLATGQQGPRPAMASDGAALLDRFREKSVGLASSVATVQNSNDIPAAVAAYLAEQRLPARVVCWPALAAMPWAAAGLGVEARGAREGDLVGITGCFCAIAETGTLMLLSGRETPATVSLLPETHIAILPAARIVAGMEDAWALMRAERGEPPRAVNFISGPSRTGDIEQTIVLGAHGPYRVHIVIVAESVPDCR